MIKLTNQNRKYNKISIFKNSKNSIIDLTMRHKKRGIIDWMGIVSHSKSMKEQNKQKLIFQNILNRIERVCKYIKG